MDIQMIIFERKFVSQPGLEPQITLTTQATVTRLPTRKQISLSFVKFQSRTLMNVTCYYSFLRAIYKWVFWFGFTYILTSHLVLGLFKFQSKTLMNVTCYYSFLRATHKWVFQFGFTYILTSHLVSQKISSICPSDIKIFNINKTVAKMLGKMYRSQWGLL